MVNNRATLVILGALLTMGGTKAAPTVLEKARENFVAQVTDRNGLVFKSILDYVTRVDEIGKRADLTDEQRHEEIGNVSYDDAALRSLAATLVAQLKKEAVELSAPQLSGSLASRIYQSFEFLVANGCSKEIIADHQRRLLNIIVFAYTGNTGDNGRTLSAIAEMVGCNWALIKSLRHPNLAMYAFGLASAIALGVMVEAVRGGDGPLSTKFGSYLTYLAFGPEAKNVAEVDHSFIRALYNSPVVDALFTPLQLVVHPVETIREKPILSGLSMLGYAMGCSVAYRRLSGQEQKRYRPLAQAGSRHAGNLHRSGGSPPGSMTDIPSVDSSASQGLRRRTSLGENVVVEEGSWERGR